MITNNIFSLSEYELKTLNELVEKHAAAWASEDLSESFNYTVSFNVHLMGVDVGVQIGNSELRTFYLREELLG
jgi:hypothetical protein